MASAMLRGSKVLWWVTPPALGLAYHLSTVKAADNVNRKINPKDLEIYDKTDKQQSVTKSEDDSPTALEEKISTGRKFVWKHAGNAKKATDSSTEGFKKFVENAREFAKNIQTDRSLQVKTGAITIASITGLLLAGKGRRPLRRVFFAGGLGTATAAVCYPSKAASVAKDVSNKVSLLFRGFKSEPSSSSTKQDETEDMLRSGETLLFEEAIIISQMVYDELRERIHVEDMHLSDFKTVCHEVVEEILQGISEDFEVQTGGFIGGKHTPSAGHEDNHVLLQAEDITKRAVQEVLDSIDEDMDIQTGGTHSEVPTIALDSTVLAKDITAGVTKTLEEDLVSSSAGQAYLFSDPDKLATIVSEQYLKSVEEAINTQVKTGRCHVILNSTSLAAKTGTELREAIESLKKRRSSIIGSGRPVNVSDSGEVTKRVASSLLDYIEHHLKTSRGKDYGYTEAGHIVRKASKEAAKAILSDMQASGEEVKGKKKRILLDLAKMIGKEVTEAIEEDIEIQTGSGFRRPAETAKTKSRKWKQSPPLSDADASALEGIMLSPMYVPGLEHLADAISKEISEDLHGRGVIVTELDHLARLITHEVLDGINEDIEIQTGGWTASEHKPHVVLNARDLIKMAAKEVLEAIEEDMNIQTGGSLERKRDLFFNSSRLSGKIVDAIMREVDRDMKVNGSSDKPFLFSLPEQLSAMATKELAENIEEGSVAIGRNVGRVHVDVDSLAEGVGRQLKNRIEEAYIRAKARGELSDEREIAIVDLEEIRKNVGAKLKQNLDDNPLVMPRPGDEPLHVVKEVGSLTKRVVEEMTKAIQEDIEIQTGGARPGAHGGRLNIVIDARQLAKKVIEEIEEAVEEDIDIQTGRGFRPQNEQVPEEKPKETASSGNPGQSEPGDKDMYSTRSG